MNALYLGERDIDKKGTEPDNETPPGTNKQTNKYAAGSYHSLTKDIYNYLPKINK